MPAGTRIRPAGGTSIGIHAILIGYAVIAIFPVLLITMNSLKTRVGIFTQPYLPPLPGSFSVIGYQTMLERAHFGLYFANSAAVAGSAMALIMLLGAMAGFALAEYRFRGNAWVGLYLALGIMIPIRLGTVSILRLMSGLSLTNTLFALILVYTAQGLPLAVFILQQFMRQVPSDLKDAGRIDGMSEYRIFWLVLPLVRPAVATVAIFTMIPIWNDLWFPLILAPGESTKTLTLGAQLFLGQFVSNWNAVLASLTVAMLPVLAVYAVFSRSLIRGLTVGALK
jgi:raffinose/stachyose/melibiose transport system permease protein